MRHLVNNIYLEYEAFFDIDQTSFDKIIFLDQSGNHPVSKITQTNVGFEKSLQDYISEDFDNNFDLFWKHYLSYEKPIVFICDNKTYMKILFSFWKTIIADNSNSNLFQLYQREAQNWELKKVSFNSSQKNQLLHFEKLFYLEDFKQFDLFISNIAKINGISKDISLLPLDIMLANYMVNDQFQYNSKLNKQLQNYCYRLLTQKFIQIKRAFLTRLDLLSELLQVDFISEPKKLKQHQFTSWIFNPLYSNNNYMLIVEDYPHEILDQIIDIYIHFKLKVNLTDKKEIETKTLSFKDISTQNLPLFLNKLKDQNCLTTQFLAYDNNQININEFLSFQKNNKIIDSYTLKRSF